MVFRLVRGAARRSRKALTISKKTRGEPHVVIRPTAPSDTSSELIDQISDTVPMSLALGIVVVYTFVCAAIFMLWEDRWTYGQSLYFFFVSLANSKISLL